MKEVVAPLVGQLCGVLGVIPNTQPRVHHFFQYLEWFLFLNLELYTGLHLISKIGQGSSTLGLLCLLFLQPSLIPLPPLHPHPHSSNHSLYILSISVHTNSLGCYFWPLRPDWFSLLNMISLYVSFNELSQFIIMVHYLYHSKTYTPGGLTVLLYSIAYKELVLNIHGLNEWMEWRWLEWRVSGQKSSLLNNTDKPCATYSWLFPTTSSCDCLASLNMPCSRFLHRLFLLPSSPGSSSSCRLQSRHLFQETCTADNSVLFFTTVFKNN